MRTHKISYGDTLSKIAQRYYGDAGLFSGLADFNGIIDANRIVAGQILQIPSQKELLKPQPKDSLSEQIIPPHGLSEIIETFGDISKGINSDGRLSQRWQDKHLARFKLPWPIPLSWNQSLVVRNLYCHIKLGEIYQHILESIERDGLKHHIHTFGGCFNFRQTRFGSKLSTHSWGIAIDLNVATNNSGTTGDMNDRIIQLFCEHGFKWGGDWSGRSKDPMHFQFCTGY